MVKYIHFRRGEVIPEGTGSFNLKYTPEYVVVKLDGDISMKAFGGLEPNHVPIFPKDGHFSVKLRGKKSVSIKRNHFPIVPRFSCTAHKSQGQTLTKAIIDLVRPAALKKSIEINFAYVPLSRVRRLQDLTILRPFDPSILRAKVNDGCAAMMAEFKARDLCKDM